MFLGLVQTCSKAVTGSNTIFTLGVSEPCTGRRQPPLVASMQCWYCKCYVLLGIHRYPFTTFCILVGIVLPTIYVLLSTQQRFSIDTNFNWMNLKKGYKLVFSRRSDSERFCNNCWMTNNYTAQLEDTIYYSMAHCSIDFSNFQRLTNESQFYFTITSFVALWMTSRFALSTFEIIIFLIKKLRIICTRGVISFLCCRKIAQNFLEIGNNRDAYY